MTTSVVRRPLPNFALAELFDFFDRLQFHFPFEQVKASGWT